MSINYLWEQNLGFESNITSSLQLTGAFTIGDYLYKSRPVATITRDNSQEVIAFDKVIYLKNFKIGGNASTSYFNRFEI